MNKLKGFLDEKLLPFFKKGFAACSGFLREKLAPAFKKGFAACSGFLREKLAPAFKKGFAACSGFLREKVFPRIADDLRRHHVVYLRTLCGLLALVLVLSVSSAISPRTARADMLSSERVLFSNEITAFDLSDAVALDTYVSTDEAMSAAEIPEVSVTSYAPAVVRPDAAPFELISEAPYAESAGGPLVIEVGSANYQYQYGSVGWLNIPGTTINNAVMQARNNDYYLTHNEYGGYSSYGCYFADYECTFGPRSALSGNTVIYGHHFDTGVGDAPNNIKFGQLFKYRDPSFGLSHPYIYFSTASERMTWQVFAVFYVNLNVDRQVNIVRGDPYSLASYGLGRSMYHFGTSVSPGDKILTLYTCSFRDGTFASGRSANIRFIVMAKLI